MATPLGTTFSIDEQVMAQGDVTFIVRTVESLIVEFDQTKYEEFFSSGSKSPRAWQYSKVSSEIRSKVFSENSLEVATTKSVMAGHITCKVRVNVSNETREANIVKGQFGHTLPLPQL